MHALLFFSKLFPFWTKSSDLAKANRFFFVGKTNPNRSEKILRRKAVLTFIGFDSVLPSTNDQLSVRLAVDRPEVMVGRGYVGNSLSLHKMDDWNACFIFNSIHLKHFFDFADCTGFSPLKSMKRKFNSLWRISNDMNGFETNISKNQFACIANQIGYYSTVFFAIQSR